MNIELFTVDAQETLTRMQIQIRDVGSQLMSDQLVAWQSEDMHRKYPNVEQLSYVSTETTIWPRSRTYEQTHPRAKIVQHQRRRALASMPRHKGTAQQGSHRPILRPELFDQLRERMSQLLAVNLSWVTSKTKGAQPPTSAAGP